MLQFFLRGLFIFLFFFSIPGCINKNKADAENKINKPQIKNQNNKQEPTKPSLNKYVSKYTTPCNSPNCCESNIISLANGSQNNIIIALHSFNNNNIFNAILEAKKRGVDIKIIIDRSQEKIDGSVVKKLLQDNFSLKFKKSSRIESNKFAIFDSLSLVNGSYSWNNSTPSDTNTENCMIDKRAHIIDFYKNNFEELWSINSEIDTRDIVIESKKAKTKKHKKKRKAKKRKK